MIDLNHPRCVRCEKRPALYHVRGVVVCWECLTVAEQIAITCGPFEDIDEAALAEGA